MTIPQTITMRRLVFALLAATTITTTTTWGWTLSPAPLSVLSRRARVAPLYLSDSSTEKDKDEGTAADSKTKLATDLQRLFDINQMAYTVMVREENKGPDGKLTPDQLIAAIQKDGMFGEDFEEYCDNHASDGDVEILDIGKFSETMESSAPLPDEANLVIPGKGNYLVHLSFAKGILATMRVVVD